MGSLPLPPPLQISGDTTDESADSGLTPPNPNFVHANNSAVAKISDPQQEKKHGTPRYNDHAIPFKRNSSYYRRINDKKIEDLTQKHSADFGTEESNIEKLDTTKDQLNGNREDGSPNGHEPDSTSPKKDVNNHHQNPSNGENVESRQGNKLRDKTSIEKNTSGRSSTVETSQRKSQGNDQHAKKNSKKNLKAKKEEKKTTPKPIILPAPSILDFMTEGEVKRLTKENTRKNIDDARKNVVNPVHFNRVCRRLGNIRFDEKTFILIPPEKSAEQTSLHRHASPPPRHMLFSPSRMLHSRTAAVAAAAASNAAAAVAAAQAAASAAKAKTSKVLTSPVTPCSGNEADDEDSFGAGHSGQELSDHELKSGRNSEYDSKSDVAKSSKASSQNISLVGNDNRSEGDISGLFDDSDDDERLRMSRHSGMRKGEPSPFAASDGESSVSSRSSSFSTSISKAAKSALRKSFNFKSYPFDLRWKSG